MKDLSVFFSLIVLCGALSAQNDNLIARAYKTAEHIKIDGHLTEQTWKMQEGITNFVQFEPYNGRQPAFQTVVKIAYDNTSLYFAVVCYDNSPDSILRQLGDRDTEVNADDIIIQFDPYNNKQDAYFFRVTASNVQSEWRMRDYSYYAVWYSRTAITDSGWVAEIQIPFSSIRIPAVQQHQWLFQVTRNIRRYREFSKWAPEQKGVDNNMIYWGTLAGIENIQHSIQLFLRPYVSLYTEVKDSKKLDIRDVYPITGLDLKYGLNESFTLDVTLLPDFSQVKSDDIVKNLSAFEVYYSEQRPFFYENMDLFHSGGILYTRRIGRIPANFYNVQQRLQPHEQIIENPASVRLLNALKVSGQTPSGISVGFFNAITDAAYAKIQDSTGRIYDIETEPLTNYSVAVVRAALPYNSNIYAIHGSVMRNGGWADAMVSGAGFRLLNKSNTYAWNVNTVMSQKDLRSIRNISSNNAGLMLNSWIGKVRGNLIYNYNYQMKNAIYDINDIGLNYTNDEDYHSASLTYRILHPFWKLLRFHNTLSVHYTERRSSRKPTSNGISYSISTTTKNHLSLWGSVSTQFSERYDYYEPRTPGYFVIWPRQSLGIYYGFSSDYRKPFALDGNFSFSSIHAFRNTSYSYTISPIIRANNHFQFSVRHSQSWNINARGYAGRSDGSPIFGRRNVYVIENGLNGKYIFRNNLSLSLRLRHYITQIDYNDFYVLSTSGRLQPVDYELSFDDLLFHTFQMDMVFYWEFAPGSSLHITWKNAIIDERNQLTENYLMLASDLLSLPFTHYFNIKIMYYLDYSRIRHMLSKQRIGIV